MPLNYRSGFNRTFVVIWAGWAAYCLIFFPFVKRSEIAHSYDKDAIACFSSASASPENPHPYVPTFDEKKKCYDDSLKLREVELNQYSIRNYYLGDSLLLGIAIFLLPPIAYALLFGSFLGTKRILTWVKRGFTS